MKVLDATFLIDYLAGDTAARDYLLAHQAETFVIPAPAFAEVLVGEGNGPGESDLDGLRDSLAWAEVYPTDEQTAITAAKIAEEMPSEAPYLTGMDAIIAAVGRELDAPVVSADRDLTHRKTTQVITVESYRNGEDSS